MHDTFNKIHDFIQSRKGSTDEWINTHRKHEVYLSMIYPVIVLQGEIYESYEENGDIKLQKVNHAIFEFNRYDEDSSSLLIDIITEDYFLEYLKLLKNDMENLKDVYVQYYAGNILKNPRPKPNISKQNNR
jgi:hypothetical protein